MSRTIFILGIISLVLTSQTVFAYDNKTTHPALTDEAIDLYNFNSGNKITGQEKEWIIEGSILEDTEPRYVNHFYDPVYRVGWSGEHAVLSQGIMQKITEIGIAPGGAVSAPDWAQNQELQEKYKLYQGNRTWQKALYEYVKNKNKKEAFTALGYVLHLLEDMSAPEHTRNDTHTPLNESPYENYAKQYTRDNFHAVEELKNQPTVIFNSLNGYFESLANYSNNYFFSKDTINDAEYNKPIIIREDDDYAYGKDKDDKEFSLSRVYITLVDYKVVKVYDIQYKSTYYPLLESYFTRLSSASVLNAAGLIRLFFEEAERAEKNPLLLQQPPGSQSAMISIFGEMTKAGNALADGAIDVKNIWVGNIIEAGNFVSNTWNNLLGLNVETSSQLANIQLTSQPAILTPMPTITFSPTPVPTPKPSPAPTLSSTPAPKAIEIQLPSVSTPQPTPASKPDFEALPTLTPTPTPTPAPFVPSLPWPGFGGGGEAPKSEIQNPKSETNSNDQNPNFQNRESEPEPEPSPTPEPTPPPDTTGPDIAFSISECSASLSSDGCLVAATTLNPLWQSDAEDLDYFELNFNGTVSTTTATSTIVEVSDNGVYTFSIAALDKTGNRSQTKSQIVEISTMPVVINEVAWAGTGPDYPVDEWIELYNRTSKDVNLENWILYSETDFTPYIKLSGTIPAKGYYLMERTDDNTVSDIAADLIYGSDTSDWDMADWGEVLVLSSAPKGNELPTGQASTTIDQTVVCIYGYGWTKWCPDYDYKYRTMERINPGAKGNEVSNWQANKPLVKNGKNAGGGNIYGTPKAKNSLAHFITYGFSSNLDSDLILAKENNPYLVDNCIYIGTGATLTIEPGVVIKFAGGCMSVGNGKIIAKGTAEEPIVFTSFEDDEYGGDSNNDATSTLPYSGSWFGVGFEAGSSDPASPAGGSVIDHAIFRYGGKWYSGIPGYSLAILDIKNASPQITNSVFEYSTVHGLRLTNSDSIISGNIFRNNNRVGDPAGNSSALNVSGGSPVISNNRFEKNQRGMNIYAPLAKVDSNYFESNFEGAIYSDGHMADFTNNSGRDNGVHGIWLYGDIVNPGSTAHMKPNSLPFTFSYGISVPPNATLIIEPGVTLKSGGGYWGGALYVSGNLIVNGQTSGDVFFTSFGNEPKAGDWNGICVASGGTADIRGATIGFASKGISYQNSPVKLENVKFENNTLGIFADEATLANYPVSAVGIEIEDFGNTATTSPPGLW